MRGSPINLFFLNNFFYICYTGGRGQACHGTHVEVKGELGRVCSLLPFKGLGAQTQVVRHVRKCLYLLSQLAGLSVPAERIILGLQVEGW